jgi:hypothetical protein
VQRHLPRFPEGQRDIKGQLCSRTGMPRDAQVYRRMLSRPAQLEALPETKDQNVWRKREPHQRFDQVSTKRFNSFIATSEQSMSRFPAAIGSFAAGGWDNSRTNLALPMLADHRGVTTLRQCGLCALLHSTSHAANTLPGSLQ